MKRRILAILLACMMVVSVFPMTAFAEGEHADCDHEECAEHTPAGEAVNTVAPTCVDVGYDLFKCATCGHFYADNLKMPIGKEGHNYVLDTAEVPATCTEPGTEAIMKCETCGEIDPDNDGSPIDVVDHTKGEAIEGTCSGYICSVCSARVNDAEHVWSELPTIVTEPTPTAEGSATYECTAEGCGKTKTVRILPQCSHENIKWVLGQGNALCDGSSYMLDMYVCEACGMFGFDETGAEMMTEAEYWEAHGKKINEAVRASHDYEIHTIESTCTTPGVEIEICANCGKQGTAVRYTPVLGHDLSEEAVIVAPTCQQRGYNTYACLRENCTYVYEDRINWIPRLGHDWTYVEVPATCVSEGYFFEYCLNAADCDYDLVSTCEVEGVSYVVSVNEDGEVDPNGSPVALNYFTVRPKNSYNHVWDVDEVIKEATCESAGNGVRYCANCDFWQNYIIPGGHEWSEPETVAPTCAADGYTIEVCSKCGEEAIYNETSVKGIPATYKYATYEDAVAHHPNLAAEGKVLVAGDCAIKGVATYACADCGVNVMVYIEGTGDHVWDTPAAEATCETPATDVGGTCVNCGETKDTAIEGAEALGHDYVEVTPAQAGDCTTDAVKALYACSRCEAVDPERDGSVETPAPGHDYTETPAVAPKCGVPGTEAYYECACGDSYGGEEIPALEHDYVVVDSNDVDCDEFGYVHFECTNCGDEYIDDYIPEYGHTPVDDAEVKASCTQPGLTAGSHCETCGDVLVEQQEVVVPHKNANGDVLEDKCTNTFEDRECVMGCGQKISNDTHTAPYEVVVPVTCLTDGYTISLCEDCWSEGKETISDVVKAEGHKWDDGVVTTAPTTGVAGEMTYTCTVCEETKTEAITALADKLNFALTIDNVNAPEKGYTDSSLISVTVAIEADEDATVGVWGVNYAVTYDATALTFVGVEMTSDKFPVVTKNPADGVVTMLASTAVDQAGAVNAEITDDEYVLATLQFRVTKESGDITLSVDGSAIDNEGKDIVAESTDATIDIQMFMDVAVNGAVNLADLLAAYDAAIAGEYNVVADVDKSGTLNFQDILNIADFLVGAQNYEGMTALGQ